MEDNKDNTTNETIVPSVLFLEEKNRVQLCLKRFEALKKEYPKHQDFFEDNKTELLGMLDEVLSEQELRDLRIRFEVANLNPAMAYEYSSSSIFAAEDVMIALLDFKRELIKRKTRTTSSVHGF